MFDTSKTSGNKTMFFDKKGNLEGYSIELKGKYIEQYDKDGKLIYRAE